MTICRHRRRIMAATCVALSISGCGLFSSSSPDVEELEAKIAVCLGIPAEEITLELDEQGRRESISLPARLPEARIVECMDAAGVGVGAGGL